MYFTEHETLKYEKTGGKHERKTYFRWEKTGICRIGSRSERGDRKLSGDRHDHRCPRTDPLWYWGCIGGCISESADYYLLWAAGWFCLWGGIPVQGRRYDLFRWVPAGTVRSESRFRRTVCETSEWRGKSGDPFRDNLCYFRNTDRGADRGHQVPVH